MPKAGSQSGIVKAEWSIADLFIVFPERQQYP
jgi:hypothetical protein